ncbi:nicotinate-nucleotide adenylyltransferase [Robbsia andropogonis]|nr:nicotinate-nucleotide adenylyltransferase [Robbsia andropogonis]MCP1116769.1 nicotinate-nucleotide adenylyltransferase [Robbsia andropogonis]MCP1126552.1 nicotinate-nucleotide adenylyltransferase [Robbsia andropogonis]
MSERPKRIAILGGTFDPIHEGHMALGSRFSRLLALDELVLLPAGQPWQKSGVSAPAHRLAMTRLAATELARRLAEQSRLSTHVSVGTDEVDRQGNTYTVETLRAWRPRIGDEASLSLLIGADQLVGLDRWHDWLHLFDYAHVCVEARPGFDLTAVSPAVAAQLAHRQCDADAIQQRPCGGIFIDQALDMPISATEIRDSAHRGLADGAKACEHVPDTVWHYVRDHHLYKD